MKPAIINNHFNHLLNGKGNLNMYKHYNYQPQFCNGLGFIKIGQLNSLNSTTQSGCEMGVGFHVL